LIGYPTPVNIESEICVYYELQPESTDQIKNKNQLRYNPYTYTPLINWRCTIRQWPNGKDSAWTMLITHDKFGRRGWGFPLARVG